DREAERAAARECRRNVERNLDGSGRAGRNLPGHRLPSLVSEIVFADAVAVDGDFDVAAMDGLDVDWPDVHAQFKFVGARGSFQARCGGWMRPPECAVRLIPAVFELPD